VLFVFVGESASRDVLTDGEEGTLHWIPRDVVLTYDLVEDLPILLPRIFAMKPSDSPLFVHVSYDANDVIQMRFAEA
jgi:hypothetical protein